MLNIRSLRYSLMLAILALGLLPTDAEAQDQTYLLRWLPPAASDLAGYYVYIRTADQAFGEQAAIDIGLPQPDSDGVASLSLNLPADIDHYVAMTAYDASQNESALSNEAHVVASASEPPPNNGTLMLDEDFDSYGAGDDPPGWYDTGHLSSLNHDEPLFETLSLNGGGVAFGTTQNRTSIHSHYVGAGSSDWSAYEYSGRMMLTNLDDGMGVTFLSDYPNSDTYYRIARWVNKDFHLGQHPYAPSSCEGTTDSGVFASANLWYRFRIHVDARGSETVIRARIWRESHAEPGAWQIDCVERGPNRLTRGTTGVWTVNTGASYWDDLEVRDLADSGGDPACDGAQCDDGNPCTSDSCDAFGCLNDAVADGTTCDDGDAGTVQDTCQSGACSGVTPQCTTNVECSDGIFCNGIESCVDFSCVNSSAQANGTVCEDGNTSTVNDMCIEGMCLGEIPECSLDSDCDDGNFCNGAESCSGVTCVSSAPLTDGTSCNDGDSSTTNDVCSAGTCSGVTPECSFDSDCDDGNICNGDESCDGLQCVSGTHRPNGVTCNDGNSATTNDSCNAGLCVGTVPQCLGDSDCDDGNVCNGFESCNDQVCVSGGTAPDGSLCDDGDPRTVGDTCSLGSCAGQFQECTSDGDCDDGNHWNGEETCVDFSCVEGEPRVPSRPILLD